MISKKATSRQMKLKVPPRAVSLFAAARKLAVVSTLCSALTGTVRGDIFVEAHEVSGGVTFSFQGAIDVTDFGPIGSVLIERRIIPRGHSGLGPDFGEISFADGWVGGFLLPFTSPPFGSGPLRRNPDSFFGDAFGFTSDAADFLIVPLNYSGEQISGEMTFNTATFLTLGVDPTPYEIMLPGMQSIFVFQAPPAPGATGAPPAPGAPTPRPSTSIDLAAMMQVSSSAIPMNQAIGQVASNVHNVGVRDLNQRLYRVRSRFEPKEGVASSSTFEQRGRNVAASRYFNMQENYDGNTSVNISGNSPRSSGSSSGGSGLLLNDSSSFLSVERQAGATLSPGTVAAGENWEAFASANFGTFEIDSLAGSPGIESDTRATSIGVEISISDSLSAGIGWSHVWNDNTLANNVGSVDLEGDAVAVYATYFKNNLWADLAYSYGKYDTDIRRNTGMGASVTGDTEVDTHQTSFNIGYNMSGGRGIVHGPAFGATYSAGSVDSYAETGNARFITQFGEQEFDSLITTLGWQFSLQKETRLGMLTPQLRIGYGRENIDQDQSIQANLVNSPFILSGNQVGGFGTGLTRNDPGKGWLDLGIGTGLQLTESAAIYFDYQGQFFRQDAEAHFGSIRAEVKF